MAPATPTIGRSLNMDVNKLSPPSLKLARKSITSDDEDDELPSFSKLPSTRAIVTPDPQRTAHLLAFASQRASKIKKSREVDHKVSSIISEGGVLKRTKQIIKEHNLEDVQINDCSSPLIEPTSTDGLPDHLISNIFPPGVALFNEPVTFLDTLSIPETNIPTRLSLLPEPLLEEGNIRDMILNKHFLLVFRSEPCPLEIMYWLLEISCLSRDYLLRQSAFIVLKQILQHSQSSPVFFPNDEQLTTILTKLGTTVEILSYLSSTSTNIKTNSTEFVRNTEEKEILKSSIKYIIEVLRIAYHKRWSVSDIEKHVGFLFRLLLDPVVCQSIVSKEVWTCLEMLIVTLSDAEYAKIEESVVLLINYANHHLNTLYLIQSMPTTTPRMAKLQRILARGFLLSSIEKEAQLDLEDDKLAISVLGYYLSVDITKMNYTKLHSVMTVVDLFIKPPDMKWPSYSDKQSFLNDLTRLGTKKIRDNVLVPEVGPVKDLIIRMKLNLEQEEGRSGLRQTNLFSFLMENSQ